MQLSLVSDNWKLVHWILHRPRTWCIYRSLEHLSQFGTSVGVWFIYQRDCFHSSQQKLMRLENITLIIQNWGPFISKLETECWKEWHLQSLSTLLFMFVGDIKTLELLSEKDRPCDSCVWPNTEMLSIKSTPYR